MIHKIKAMYDNGNGASIKAIARSLDISRNTVRKYLRLNADEIETTLSGERYKHLDDYRDYLAKLLTDCPELKTPKIYRKLKAKVPDLPVSERSLRRYLEGLRPTLTGTNQRHYEPIIDDVPGVQCQVDGGELRDVLIGGVTRTLYFLVFVLSFSRLMYIGTSLRPINTDRFIQMHDEAFRYFGGVPEECVYDQAKVAVIDEIFREVELNSRFQQFALHHSMNIHVCEGFDPESKGKVESGVKYAKGDCFCGEHFVDGAAIQTHVLGWLDEVANERLHGTTNQIPRELFDAREQTCLKPYQPYVLVPELMTRKADKTGLISYKTNRYSVPLTYQRSRVAIRQSEDQLLILHVESGEEVARHTLVSGKSQIIKNTHHYRDVSAVIANRESELITLTGEHGVLLCDLLKRTSPKIYKDQLAGVIKLLKQIEPVDTGLLARLTDRQTLKATQVRDYVNAYQRRPEDFEPEATQSDHRPAPAGLLAGYGSLHEQGACL